MRPCTGGLGRRLWKRVAGACCGALLVSAATAASAEVIERLLAAVSGQLIMASDVAAVRRLGLVPDGTDREVLERLIESTQSGRNPLQEQQQDEPQDEPRNEPPTEPLFGGEQQN